MKKSGVLNMVILFILAGGVVLMLYGLINYPSAPIRQVNEKFLDKQKNEYTVEEFRAFKIWETTLFVYWFGCIGGGFIVTAIHQALQKEHQ
jgi:hypothetical protein